MKPNKWFILLIMLSIIATGVLYPYLPDQVPAHWNVKGEIDRYEGKITVFFTAVLPLLIYALIIYLPKIDPKKAAYLKHEKAYMITKSLIVLFLVLVHWVTMGVALGYNINVGIVIKLGIGILFIVLGNYMSQIRQNYFFGIKTPWTLANEEVWKKTHRMGGYGFVVLGIITMLTTLLKENNFSVGIMVVSILGFTGYLFLYSYLTYSKMLKK